MVLRMVAENMGVLGHSNSSSQGISIFLYLFPEPQFLKGDTRGQVREPVSFILGSKQIFLLL